MIPNYDWLKEGLTWLGNPKIEWTDELEKEIIKLEEEKRGDDFRNACRGLG